jgi:hypothetical protein
MALIASEAQAVNDLLAFLLVPAETPEEEQARADRARTAAALLARAAHSKLAGAGVTPETVETGWEGLLRALPADD